MDANEMSAVYVTLQRRGVTARLGALGLQLELQYKDRIARRDLPYEVLCAGHDVTAILEMEAAVMLAAARGDVRTNNEETGGTIE